MVAGTNFVLGTELALRNKVSRLAKREKLEPGTSYFVKQKAGIAIKLSDGNGKLTEWIANPEDLDELQPIHLRIKK